MNGPVTSGPGGLVATLRRFLKSLAARPDARARGDAAPPVAVRRVTLEGADPPRRMRPEPPRPPRRTLAIGPYAPRTEVRGNVVVALRPEPEASDNIFRDDFTP